MKSKKQIRKSLRYALIKGILRCRNFDVRDSIILCSEPRSGSTWLMEMLQKHPGTIVNWEPLHVDLGVMPGRNKPVGRLYIPPDEFSPEYHELFEKILTLKVQSPWTTREIRLRDTWSANVVLTKFVRANRLLPWFARQFDLRRKPIYLVRHPIPTCMSQMKHFPKLVLHAGMFGTKDFASMERDDERFGVFKELSGQLEIRIGLWAMYNAVVMLDPGHSYEWNTIFYEDLIRNPLPMIESLNTALNLQVPTHHLNPQQASRTDFSNDFLPGESESQLTRWMDKLSHSELATIQHILDYFKISAYSAFSPYPL